MRLNCQVRFGGCDLHTRFSGAGCRPICRFLLLLLLLCCLSLCFPSSFRTLKDSKVRSGIRCREVCDGAGGCGGGVRRAFHSRCALLNIILLYKYINIYISPPRPPHPHKMSPAARCIRFASFVLRFSLFFFPPRQTVENPESRALARLVASQNTKGNIGGEICLSVCPFNTRTPRPFLLSFSFFGGDVGGIKRTRLH